MSPIRQHLIDPEVCIRCNTCQETCPIDAVTHNDDNYVVDAAVCDYCMDCISPCPTGAIDNWRTVAEPYAPDAQLLWDELPDELDLNMGEAALEALDAEVETLIEQAHAGQRGTPVAPSSAAKPAVNLYGRKQPAVATVTGNYRITAADAESDVRHLILDFGGTAFPVLEGQSLGIIPPGTDAGGRPHHIRLYSVSSSRDGERPNHNNVALTVKRHVGKSNGETYQGIGSNYLCDLRKGDRVQVTGPFGNTFLMPEDPATHLIMICTGTGSAPFRAMTERRRRAMPDAPGGMLLFFGARTPAELPYFGPLGKVPERLLEKELVFSRLSGRAKEYVQHRMRARAERIAALLKDDQTYIYVCGLKGMESGVEEALGDICAEHGLDWEAVRATMQQSGRYHIETY